MCAEISRDFAHGRYPSLRTLQVVRPTDFHASKNARPPINGATRAARTRFGDGGSDFQHVVVARQTPPLPQLKSVTADFDWGGRRGGTAGISCPMDLRRRRWHQHASGGILPCVTESGASSIHDSI